MRHATMITRQASGRCTPLRWSLSLALLATILAGCDAGGIGVLGPGTSSGRTLVTGSYDYRAWSSRHGGLAWWGYLDIRVDSSGRISGFYRLPRQCSDRFGPGADCVGHVGGRIYRDGSMRFGLDEGWLSHEGNVNRRSDATGRWWGRMLGYSEEGDFELLLY